MRSYDTLTPPSQPAQKVNNVLITPSYSGSNHLHPDCHCNAEGFNPYSHTGGCPLNLRNLSNFPPPKANNNGRKYQPTTGQELELRNFHTPLEVH